MEARPGDTLIIVSERGQDGYYSTTLDQAIATHASDRSLRVTILDAPVVEQADHIPGDVKRAMDSADHTLFLARIGDQVRFTELGGGGTKTMCYALDEAAFGTAFCSADHRYFKQFKRLVNKALFGNKQIAVTCPSGTQLAGVSPPEPGDDDVGDVSVRRFPMTVFRPMSAETFSGKLALTRWLCPTGSRIYEPDCVLIDGVLFAHVEAGRLVGFEGDPADVERVRGHYRFVSAKYDIERDIIHSWHAGIHPQNGYTGLAIHNLKRWSGSAFGNPRYLHLHSCGNYAPGEICVSVFDPTISADGVDLWHDGRLVFADSTEAQSLMSNYPGIRELFAKPEREFGLGDNSSSG